MSRTPVSRTSVWPAAGVLQSPALLMIVALAMELQLLKM